MYSLVGNQVRMAPMGEVIGLDYGAVLDTIKLYVTDGEVKKFFEGVLYCYQLEQEFVRTKE